MPSIATRHDGRRLGRHVVFGLLARRASACAGHAAIDERLAPH